MRCEVYLELSFSLAPNFLAHTLNSHVPPLPKWTLQGGLQEGLQVEGKHQEEFLPVQKLKRPSNLFEPDTLV